MLPKLHFVSKEGRWIDHMTELFKKDTNVQVSRTDIRSVQKEYTTFVSPANCLGFMDGGIDWVLSREMFDGVEQAVRNRIERIGICTGLGRFYLPIGSALLVPTNREHSYLISAPTMFLPHDVSETKNAYWSFLAALMLHKQWTEHTNIPTTLVVTSHCCGYGKMLPEVSANQMRQAYTDFCIGKVPEKVGFQTNPYVMLLQERDEEQPNNYDNREIKQIAVTDVMLKRP